MTAAAQAVSSRAAAIEAATPPARDRVVDLLRAGSLVVVVLGHWLMAGIVVADGGISGVNALATVPVLRPLTWILQVMPLFFIAGGFSNLTVWRRLVARGDGYADYVRTRLVRLVRPTLVFVLVTQAALAGLRVAAPVGLGPAEVELIGKLLGQPLWFLGVYVVVTALAPAMAAWHARLPVAAPAVLALVAAAVDVGRVGLGIEPVGYLNLAVVWLFAQQVGFWYADGRLKSVPRRCWWAVLAVAFTGLVLLTGPGPYPLSMVGVPGELSNMSPPTVCVLVLSIGQAAVVMLARDRLMAWLARPERWWWVVSVGSMAMTLYLWHLAVLVAGFGVVLWLGGLPPEPGTTMWWLTRPIWLGALGVVLAALAIVVSSWERGRAGTRRPQPDGGSGDGGATPEARAAVVVAAVTLTALGLLGYVASGLAPAAPWTSTLLVIPVDPVQNTLCVAAGLMLTVRGARTRIPPAPRTVVLRGT